MFKNGDRIELDSNKKKYICIAYNKEKVAVFSPYLCTSGKYGQYGMKYRPIYNDMIATPNTKESCNFTFSWLGRYRLADNKV